MPILEDLLEQGERHVRNTLLERRERQLSGFYHLVAPEGGEDAIVSIRWRNDIEKQLQILTVRAIAHELHAVAALVVHEAWMLKLSSPTPWHAKRLLKNLPRPSESPDRSEVVQLVATDGRDTKARCLQILRDKPGGRIISLVEDKTYSGSITGQMIDGIIVPED